MSAVPKKQTPGKLAYIRLFQRTGINATKFEKTLINFKSDVFAAFAVVDANTPFYLEGGKQRKARETFKEINLNIAGLQMAK